MDKQKKIIEMFNEIAPTYDVANRVLSFGVDVRWRKVAAALALKMVGEGGAAGGFGGASDSGSTSGAAGGDSDSAKSQNNADKAPLRIADVACGTGDMMAVWMESAAKMGLKSPKIVGIDPSTGMLQVAKNKLKNCDFIEARADNTGLGSSECEILSISYGIRNVVELDAALREFRRVLKPGGLLVVLEFTKRSGGGLLGGVRDFYLSKILPKIGGLISKNSGAYEYLPSSIEGFLDAKSFTGRVENAGFEMVIARPFTMEISTLFIARAV